MAREIQDLPYASRMPVVSESVGRAITRQFDHMAYLKILTAAAGHVAQGMHGDASDAIVQIARDHEWKMAQLPTPNGPAADALMFLCADSLAAVFGYHQHARDRMDALLSDAFARLPDADRTLVERLVGYFR